MGRWAWRSIAAIICLSILVLSAIASGSVLVIRFKDGSSQQYDLSKIEALTFSDSGGAETGVAPIPGRLVWSEEFDQAVSQVWEPLQVVGGNYQAFARVQSGSFIVNVPAGNWWGKTGLMTRNPLFTVDASMQNSPANIVFEFDPQATQGFCLALSQHKNADVWLVPHLWFAYSAHPTSGEAVWSMLNGQGSERAVPGGSIKLKAGAPRMVRLQVRPGAVDMIPTGAGEAMTCPLGWLKAGTSLYVYVFSHPWDANMPASFKLESVRLYR